MKKVKRNGRPSTSLNTSTFAGLLAHNVRRLRHRLDWSVPLCSDQSGISVTSWYRLEQGIYPQSAGSQADALAEFFEVGLRELLKRP